MVEEDERDRDALIEQAAGAHRFRHGHGRVLTHPAWADLYERARVVRQFEQALDPEGLSSAARTGFGGSMRRLG